jgi:hypothetical protein
MFEKFKLKGKLGGESKPAGKSKSKGKIKGKGGTSKANALLVHGDKIGMAAVGICVLWLLYSALGRERLDASHQPEALKKLATDADQHIKNESRDVPVPPEEGRGPEKPDELAMARIDANVYSTDTPLNPTVFTRPAKRTDPQLLAPVELEASGDVGLFAFVDPNAQRLGREGIGPPPPRDLGPPPRTGESRERRIRPRGDERRRERDDVTRRRAGRGGGRDDEATEDTGEAGTGPRETQFETTRRIGVQIPADAKAEGRYFAIVVAKVPLADQVAEYRRALADAQGYEVTRDYPKYMAYQIQRKEASQPEEDWKVVESVSEQRLDALMADWAPVDVPEVVDFLYEDPLFTFPLPPLVGREWDASVTHSDVPLAPTPEEQRRIQGEFVGQPTDAETEEPQVGPDGLPLTPDPLAPGTEGGFGGSEDDGSSSLRRRPGSRARFPRGPVPPSADRARGPDEKEVTHRLFRFFDFTVQPGHSYEYRVRLVLYDPNFRVHHQYLAKEVITRLEAETQGRRFTDWSSPSPAVFIPFAGRMLVGPPKSIPADLHNMEPSATVLALMLDMNTGVEGAAEIEAAVRGSVGDFVQPAQVIEYNRAGGQLTTVEKFAFHTETTLLDMKGGDRLSDRNRDLTSPGEYLVLDPAGRLHVQTETDELDEYRKFRQRFELDQANAKRRRETDRKDDDGPTGEGGRGPRAADVLRGPGPERRRPRD